WLLLAIGVKMDSKIEHHGAVSPGNGTAVRQKRQAAPVEVTTTGVEGLDDILGGGLARNHLYLIEGDPGTGKTTIALQYLMEGARLQPARVVFDSLSEMRLLARDSLRYRRQILGLKKYFSGRSCTVLLLDDRTADVGDLQLQSIAHGVILLQSVEREYGIQRR